LIVLLDGLEKHRFQAHIHPMARWIKIILIVSSIVIGWAALSIVTFDEDAVDFSGISHDDY
jgi:hypothetical protein